MSGILPVYRVLSIPHVTDGDTLWVRREWSVGDVDGVEMLARDYLGGTKIRLDDGGKGLNAPEKKKDPIGWAEAKDDLENLVATYVYPGATVELRTTGKRDQYGRVLGDIVTAEYDAGFVYYQRNINGWAAYK